MPASGATGERSQTIIARGGVMRTAAAAAQPGLTNPSDGFNGSLAVAAAPDPFKAWWVAVDAALPDDFELAI